MQKKDDPKNRKPDLLMLIVFLIFASFAGWFFYTNQVIAGIIFAIFSFTFLRRAFSF